MYEVKNKLVYYMDIGACVVRLNSSSKSSGNSSGNSAVAYPDEKTTLDYGSSAKVVDGWLSPY